MKYVALAVVSFPENAELGLTQSQVSARNHALKPHGSRQGWWITTAPVQFKVGEKFKYDGDISKGMALSADDARKAAQARADADAQAREAAEAEALAKAQAEATARQEADEALRKLQFQTPPAGA